MLKCTVPPGEGFTAVVLYIQVFISAERLLFSLSLDMWKEGTSCDYASVSYQYISIEVNSIKLLTY